jgi:hypothetical protein
VQSAHALLQPLAQALGVTVRTKSDAPPTSGYDLSVTAGEHGRLQFHAKTDNKATLQLEISDVPPDLALFIARLCAG